MIKKSAISCIAVSVLLMGCAQVTEVGRTIWGTSTRALTDARIDAIVLNYECFYDECYKAVLGLTSDQLIEDKFKEKTFKLFHENYIKGYIVIMGVEGNVDTTEVGIFFSHIKENVTKIEVSSLSTTAKEKVAHIINKNLSQTFKKVK